MGDPLRGHSISSEPSSLSARFTIHESEECFNFEDGVSYIACIFTYNNVSLFSYEICLSFIYSQDVIVRKRSVLIKHNLNALRVSSVHLIMTQRRDPREPTPLVLMNPELRVRQLRYAANIEATLMVPLHRYYEVLLDLSVMGLEYLKAMKLERAFIIFKRIEYFIFHRLKEHPGVETFSSDAKLRILGRLPMIMYVAQQIIIDFVMPVYERQAAYFRYEELQRRLSIVNPTAWKAILPEAERREQEFYSEAEKISTRFGVELSSFLPRSVTPDNHHPSNWPPRTIPAKVIHRIKQNYESDAANAALSVAINTMNTSAESLSISGDQPIDTLVCNINAMMNNALINFFNARHEHAARFPDASLPDANVPKPSVNQLAKVNHQLPAVVMPMTQNNQNDTRNTYSPLVDHMYQMPSDLPGDLQCARNFNEDRNPYEYNPIYSIEKYIDLLKQTFETNSSTATGFRIQQVTHGQGPSPSTAAFMLRLERTFNESKKPSSAEPVSSSNFSRPRIQTETSRDREASVSIIPEPDPGTPRGMPPTMPLVQKEPETRTWGVWAKRGGAHGSHGIGSLEVLSNLDRAREVLDSVPPMPNSLESVEYERLPITHATKEQRISSDTEEIDILAIDQTCARSTTSSVKKRSYDKVEDHNVKKIQISIPTENK
ncbi:unnamed protein product [Caenorhabditis sp. 36 PRJEB53466]|nr:unnamed protein product [Caenorhabditis sp. 36 PRJEB53466]